MALVERADTGVAPPARDGDVVLGEDFVSPDTSLGREMRDRRARRGFFALKRSPLARKIIMFNLIALNVLVAGILFVNASRQSVSLQRADLLASEAALAASSFAVQLPRAVPVSLAAGDGLDVGQTLSALPLRPGIAAYVFDPRAS
ncbi:MAG: histidine kinase, partial [Rhodobacteraceae bacterium]|nr:histidine kinase [Paracoccaceae bacterium]